MKPKLSITDLADHLALATGLPYDKVEAYLEHFFALTEEALLADRLVKIKGLGDFKIMGVAPRTSIDVNSKQPIVIKSHARISFSADDALNHTLNAPFAHLTAVELHDEAIPLLAEADEAHDAYLELLTQTEAEETFTEEVIEEELEEVAEYVEHSEPSEVSASSEVSEPSETIELSEEATPSAPSTPSPFVEPPIPTVHQHSYAWRKWAIALLVFLLLVVAYLIGRYQGRAKAPVVAPITPNVVQPDTLQQDTARPSVTPQPQVAQVDTLTQDTAPAPRVEPDYDSQYPQVPGSAYQIIGTQRTLTLTTGEGLMKIARKEYGNAYLYEHIVYYNNIKDPNNVPLGTTIKLPKLRKRP